MNDLCKNILSMRQYMHVFKPDKHISNSHKLNSLHVEIINRNIFKISFIESFNCCSGCW